ncbi:MAG: tRNA preQ1(34) S-adenosylmethionine ribosyltransferase-isomerase QueA [Pseudomonadota bacterium]
MDLAGFDFDLPEDLIALRPAQPRRSARLLVSRADGLTDRQVVDLPGELRPGDLIVFNDTKVLPARLRGVRRRRVSEGTADGWAIAQVEALLLDRVDACRWRAFAKPGKRLREGEEIEFDGVTALLEAKHSGGAVTLRFSKAGPDLDTALMAIGEPPLPPYIARRRAADAADMDDYQTVFAARPGAVAAPTAALHFDTALLDALDQAGMRRACVTLHVSAGTFAPPTEADLAAGRLHKETAELTAETAALINDTKAQGGRVIAVGTTTTRVLETAARLGGGQIEPWAGETDLLIAPGFNFQIVEGLMTNFHLPKSSLIWLVAAFVGSDRAQALYAHAIAERYRFYSYGDASLLWPSPAGQRS